MSESARLIDDAIRLFVVPAMKDAGYRKYGRSWYSDDGRAVRVLNVQGSSWNSADSARFTVNLGVWYEDVATLAGTPLFKNRRPPEYQCLVRERIGDLLSPPGDHWWSIESEAEIRKEGESARLALMEAALPWLERVSEPQGAIAYLRKIELAGHSPIAAFALALSVGDRQLASQLYLDWASQRSPGLGTAIDEWAAVHALVE